MRLHLNIFLHALLARQTEMVLKMAPQIHMHMIHTRTHWHIWHTWDTHTHTHTHKQTDTQTDTAFYSLG